MNGERAHKFEQEKAVQERKRKAAYLESFFEKNAEKKQAKDAALTNSNGGKSPNHNGKISSNGLLGNTSVAKRTSMGNGNYRNDQDSPSSPKKERLSSSNMNQQQPAKPCSQGSNQYTGAEEEKTHSPTTREPTGIKVDNGNPVVVKQEKDNDGMSVQIVSVQGSHNTTDDTDTEKVDSEDDYMKFLLFAGRLYRCAKVTDLSHNTLRFDSESTQGRKGKVVVLLMFHKTYREIMSYVVGIVEHTTSKEQSITIKVIKTQTYPASLSPPKDAETKELKFIVGSKKLLYDMRPLDGPVYGELVKILDGFGANSAVDHAKISEFNAMINANADRFDGQLPNYPGSLPLPFTRSRSFVSAPFTYLGPRVNKNNLRYSPVGSRSRDVHSPPHAGPQSQAHERPKSSGLRGEVENGVRSYPARSIKGDQPVYTVAANRTARGSPGSYNGHVTSEHSRNVTSAAASGMLYSAMRDEKVERRDVQDLQTVAELCKEKMKRDMAEQELKTIRAAFEEFKSQMQHHLSQVEERMVLLEAENRNLKGKLSNMHQTTGYAEKKYHELRGRLEELLKTI